MAAPTWYNQADQDIFKDNQFITQEKYRVGPYTTQEDELTTATSSGIPYTNAFTGGGGGGGDGGGPTFNYESGRNYQPGGMYERNPLVTGVGPEIINAEGRIVPNYGLSDEMSPLQLSYATEVEHPENLSRMQRLQMGMRNFKGIDSAYENYRTKGKLGEWAKTGVGMIPWISQGLGAAANMLGLQMTGDKSDRQRWAVDGAGFGQGTGRDQFGVYTGGKTLMGDTANYRDRMQARVDVIKDKIKDNPEYKNSTAMAQLKDYEEKLRILKENEDEDIATAHQRSRDLQKIQMRINPNYKTINAPLSMRDIHGEASEELAKKAPVSVQVPRHISQPDTPSGGGQFDGAASRAEYDRAPTDYSGSFAKGGRARFFYGGLAGIL